MVKDDNKEASNSTGNQASQPAPVETPAAKTEQTKQATTTKVETKEVAKTEPKETVQQENTTTVETKKVVKNDPKEAAQQETTTKVETKKVVKTEPKETAKQ